MFNLPGPRLDSATLLFSSAVMGFVMAAFSFSAARSMPNQRDSLRDWGCAMTASGGAFLLYFLRGHINWHVSFVGGNTLILLTPLLILQAQTRLVGGAPSKPWLASIAVWSLSGVALSAILGTGPNLGAITMSSGIAMVAVMFVRQMSFHPVSRSLPAARFSAGVGALTAATFAWRTWVAVTGQLPAINAADIQSNPAHTGSLLMGALFLSATSISFFTMAHEMRRRETEESARRDGLTGLLTRTAFYQAAETLRALQPPAPLAIAMVDLDHFKNVNDLHGHAGGDHALIHMARLISSTIRSSDLVGRYGGEEFVVLLRDCDADTARRYGERLVDLANHTQVRMPGNQPLHCTLSVGLACLGNTAETLEALIVRADTALYLAKAQGRNRAMVAPAAE
jgi:diguanylate cyclase (GGDEF)-like protein